MIKEYWKPVVGYEGLYMVSNWGRVKSIKFGKERILKPVTNSSGYLLVGLYKNNIEKKYSVHRLVAEAFIPNPYNLPQVNHKDENKQNNVVSNLEWCTHEYNNTYGTRIKRQKEKIKKPIIQCDIKGNYINEFNSINDAANSLHILACNISNCLKGRQKSTPRGLYTWKYKF